MKQRKWVLQKGYVQTSRGKEAVIVCSGPMLEENVRIEVLEIGDAAEGIQDQWDNHEISKPKEKK